MAPKCLPLRSASASALFVRTHKSKPIKAFRAWPPLWHRPRISLDSGPVVARIGSSHVLASDERDSLWLCKHCANHRKLWTCCRRGWTAVNANGNSGSRVQTRIIYGEQTFLSALPIAGDCLTPAVWKAYPTYPRYDLITTSAMDRLTAHFPKTISSVTRVRAGSFRTTRFSSTEASPASARADANLGRRKSCGCTKMVSSQLRCSQVATSHRAKFIAFLRTAKRRLRRGSANPTHQTHR